MRMCEYTMPEMTPPHLYSRLEDAIASSMASEYVAYTRWARQRNLVYVATVSDYFVSLAHHLGISTPTFRRWLKAGRVKIRRTPTGELRFRISELNKLIG